MSTSFVMMIIITFTKKKKRWDKRREGLEREKMRKDKKDRNVTWFSSLFVQKFETMDDGMNEWMNDELKRRRGTEFLEGIKWEHSTGIRIFSLLILDVAGRWEKRARLVVSVWLNKTCPNLPQHVSQKRRVNSVKPSFSIKKEWQEDAGRRTMLTCNSERQNICYYSTHTHKGNIFFHRRKMMMMMSGEECRVVTRVTLKEYVWHHHQILLEEKNGSHQNHFRFPISSNVSMKKRMMMAKRDGGDSFLLVTYHSLNRMEIGILVLVFLFGESIEFQAGY